MKNHEHNFRQNEETQAAELAVIGGILATLGDALTTIAAALALQGTEEKTQNYVDVKHLQYQIDELHREVKHIKKVLKNKGIY